MITTRATQQAATAPSAVYAQRDIQVFVHLAHGYDAYKWRERWERGGIVGINEPMPYGYHRASELGCEVVHSRDLEEGKLRRMLRLGGRAVLGFDLLHAWRNRAGILAADIVWTHNESQNLAVLALLRLAGRTPKQNPTVLAQCVWLFDNWEQQPAARRWLWRRLLERAGVITVHSPANFEVARRVFPDARLEVVRFGICTDQISVPKSAAFHRPLRIISMGNDRHRDWTTLVSAVRSQPSYEARIVSHSAPRWIRWWAKNVELVRPRANHELTALFEWADVVVVPLKANLHASGTTVVQEAVVRGIPVICTDTGGLRAYFSDDEVWYVPTADAAGLRSVLAEVARSPEEARRRATRAQARLGPEGLSSQSFVRQHVDLSCELLGVSSNHQASS